MINNSDIDSQYIYIKCKADCVKQKKERSITFGLVLIQIVFTKCLFLIECLCWGFKDYTLMYDGHRGVGGWVLALF